MIQTVRHLVTTPLARGCSDTLTVMKLKQEAADWLSPPDPSVNYHIARDMRHRGTAAWFIGSSTFMNWTQSSSLMWIHGKRMIFAVRVNGVTTDLKFHSGLRQDCPYVCHMIRLVQCFVFL